VDRGKVTMENMNANEEALRSEVATAHAELMRVKTEYGAMLNASHQRDAALVEEIQAREAVLQKELARALEEMEDWQAEAEGARRELLALQEEHVKCQTLLVQARADAEARDTALRALREEMVRAKVELEDERELWARRPGVSSNYLCDRCGEGRVSGGWVAVVDNHTSSKETIGSISSLCIQYALCVSSRSSRLCLVMLAM